MKIKHVGYAILLALLIAGIYQGIQGAKNADKILNTYDLQEDSKRIYNKLSQQLTLTKIRDTTLVINRNSVDYDAIRYFSKTPKGFNNTIVKSLQTFFDKKYNDIHLKTPWTKQGTFITSVFYLVDDKRVIYAIVFYYQESSDTFIAEFSDVRKSDFKY